VLALDASGSMDETDTYVGRTKHAHVNEILQITLQRLTKTQFASRLWVNSIAFSDEVVLRPPITLQTPSFFELQIGQTLK
jgi:hypothetical protein